MVIISTSAVDTSIHAVSPELSLSAAINTGAVTADAALAAVPRLVRAAAAESTIERFATLALLGSRGLSLWRQRVVRQCAGRRPGTECPRARPMRTRRWPHA